MSKLKEYVTDFHKAGNLPIKTTPEVPSEERVWLRAKLVTEEFFEMLEGLYGDQMAFRLMGDEFISELKELKPQVDMVEFADALGDLDYVIEGARLEFGIDGGPVADEIQRANMSKFGPGSWKDETGKVRKPPDWTGPDIEKVLRQQGWKG